MDHDFEAVEQTLTNLHTKFTSGECRAFGMNTRKVMKEMAKLRAVQTDMAISQIKFNVDFPDINDELAATDDVEGFVATEDHFDRIAQAEYHQEEMDSMTEAVRRVADIVSHLGKLQQDSR